VARTGGLVTARKSGAGTTGFLFFKCPGLSRFGWVSRNQQGIALDLHQEDKTALFLSRWYSEPR
jgi:galactokinase/mevalonate kinase-like predicted kinase